MIGSPEEIPGQLGELLRGPLEVQSEASDPDGVSSVIGLICTGMCAQQLVPPAMERAD
jgi:hypothetical protein